MPLFRDRYAKLYPVLLHYNFEKSRLWKKIQPEKIVNVYLLPGVSSVGVIIL
jgi:hypothetical protein